MPSVFICYRREDTAPYAGWLRQALTTTLGKNRVFMDIDTIAPGADFEEVIHSTLDRVDAVLVLIGPKWTTVADASNQRRLDNPDDYIRLEVSTGLKRRIRVIPILVGGATVPRRDQLPEDLQSLTQRQAIELSDTRWEYDTSRLIKTLKQLDADGAATTLAPASPSPDDVSHQEEAIRVPVPELGSVSTSPIDTQEASQVDEGTLTAGPHFAHPNGATGDSGARMNWNPESAPDKSPAGRAVADPASIHCKNCGHLAEQLYCAHCGQSTKTGRLGFKVLIDEIIGVVSHGSRFRTLRTFWALAFRPGSTIRSYLKGKRHPYENPISFFAFGWFVFEVLQALIVKPQHLPHSMMTALGRSGTFAVMAINAVAAYYILARPTLNLIETLAAFAFVYGLMFFDSSALILLFAANAERIRHLPAGTGEILFDVPLLLLLLVYFRAVSRALVGPRTLRLIAAMAFGVFTFIITGMATETFVFSDLWHRLVTISARPS